MLDYCDNCKKTTSWEEEDVGAELMTVCSECGTCKNSGCFEANDDEQSSSGLGSQLVFHDQQTNVQGKFFGPRNSERKKKMRLIYNIKEIASKLNLPKQSTDRCVSCGKILLERNYDLTRKSIRIAAAVVFLDQKNIKPSLLMKDFSKQIGMKVALLCREVMHLKVSFGEMFVREAEPNKCLQDMVDKLCLKMDISQQKKIDIYKLAVQLREVTADCPLKGKRMSDVSKLSHCAYFALALQQVDPSQKEVRERIGDITEYSVLTLKNRIYMVRKKLLALAKTLPSADQQCFALDNIHCYIPTIIRNKTFLLKGNEKFYVCDGPSGSTSACAVEPEASCTPRETHWEEDGEEGTLSDLDVDQYIATEKEVEEKRALQQMQPDLALTTKPLKNKRKKSAH